MDNPILLIFGVVSLMLIFGAISIANSFVRLSNVVRESWADVDVALKRRHDLIPNLVEVVKAYAKHESEVIRQVVEARDRAVHEFGSVAAHARDESELGNSVRQLLARVEAYPELKASEQFHALQSELANTEDRIAAARRFYNSNVRDYNTRLETFPSSLFAGGRQPAEFFEVSDGDRSAPVMA